MRTKEMKEVYPLPWKHTTDGKKMSAIESANGKAVSGSLICEHNDTLATATRQAHAFIVDLVEGATAPPPARPRLAQILGEPKDKVAQMMQEHEREQRMAHKHNTLRNVVREYANTHPDCNLNKVSVNDLVRWSLGHK